MRNHYRRMQLRESVEVGSDFNIEGAIDQDGSENSVQHYILLHQSFKGSFFNSLFNTSFFSTDSLSK